MRGSRAGAAVLAAALLLPATGSGARSAGAPAADMEARSDTVLRVRPGDRLVVENFSGTLLVGAGEGGEIRLTGRSGRRTDLRLLRRGDRVSVELSTRRSGDREIDAVLRVPRGMPVAVRGLDLDVEVRGVEAPVEIRNVEGDVELEGIRQGAVVSTVDGTVTVRDARGDLSLGSQGDDVTVEDVVAGTVRVESGDGDLVLRNVDAREIRAETLDGDVLLDVPVRAGGSYRVAVHDGDAEVRVPQGAGLRVAVSTFDGEFLSDFPVTVERFRAGRSFEFTLGDGGARLEIEVFDGEIRLGPRR